MKIEWSPDAVERLRERFGTHVAGFRLVYDIEGCGCAVDGVPALWAVDDAAPGDVAADSEPIALWHDPRQSAFFEEDMRIAYSPERKSFALVSDNQTYTTRLVLEDRRAKAT